MLVNHERRLLNKAAGSDNYRISIQRNPDASWPGDHSRLTALESIGHLERVGVSDGLATWQITATGLTQLQALVGGAA
ncbi:MULTISPECIES: hypothetical protein [Methylobacterium]|jgi:hypothetical protein|uniref:ArsR family transcriptional regulator n=1 Tax=Methylobacterium brachiatum TaxID=269660 RepID=A0ABV1R3C6_9HYPH|nr:MULTISPECIES: hypothetical protein [Methylobacterium]AYO84326.1 hypothetical protein EBB05_20035 [Methylobacterium brachiatum]EIZ82364.1 hypothetical protein WYO_5003 [Methylobacterium sp. GXF4]MDH2308715.1 hypothetical protein [Methylobacterium brachiatum]CAA2156661.1 hypothetical protein MBRA_02102 [Methylobacterium brachiatum]SFI43796.1 hypothetical protein SAMN02799642_01873 [Methylobacterium brachiatum]